MKIEPIRKYQYPEYPDKEYVSINSHILKKLPKRWKTNAFVILLLSTITSTALTGCSDKISPSGSKGPFRRTEGVPKMPPKYIQSAEYYISETQAKNIIDELLFEIGLNTEEKKYLGMMEVPDYNSTNQTRIDAVTLDGYDKDKKIGYEFVSRSDLKSFGKDSDAIDELRKYKAADLPAIELSKEIKKRVDDSYIGVFYDPLINEEDSINDLKRQLKVFVKWLKGEGVI